MYSIMFTGKYKHTERSSRALGLLLYIGGDAWIFRAYGDRYFFAVPKMFTACVPMMPKRYLHIAEFPYAKHALECRGEQKMLTLVSRRVSS